MNTANLLTLKAMTLKASTFWMFILASIAFPASGEEVKTLAGISVVGNKEAPKSLFLVPWKNSEIGVETNLSSGLLDESMKPVDKEVFMRELNFYKFSHEK